MSRGDDEQLAGFYRHPVLGPARGLKSGGDRELFHALQALTLDAFTLVALSTLLIPLLSPFHPVFRIWVGAAAVLSLLAAVLLRREAVVRFGRGEELRIPLLEDLVEQQVEQIKTYRGED